MVSELLGHLDDLDEVITRLNGEIEGLMRPFVAELDRVDSIPGINQRIA